MELVKNVTVVVRSAHERTAQHCMQYIAQQVTNENITVIHERPFSTAVRTSFEIGVQSNLDWTLCVDADVLLGSGSIAGLITLAEPYAQSSHLFSLQGVLLDRLLNTFRHCGVHLYRTQGLNVALTEAIFDAQALRPETYIKEQMRGRGFRVETVDFRVGLHDYEQYFRDIYRKAFVHAHKHSAESHLPRMWHYLSAFSDDFIVALLGWQHGSQHRVAGNSVMIDTDTFPDDIMPLLASLGLMEKAPSDGIGLEVDDYLCSGSPELRHWENYCSLGRWGKLRDRVAIQGWAPACAWLWHRLCNRTS